ncbi:MAG: HAMP domain-containing sensor histidine kinase [Pseudomonadota bacterium]
MSPEQFISLVCHDLRAPLRGLKTLPDWARDEVVDAIGSIPPGLGEVLDMMTTQANRLDYIVRDLADYTKLVRSEANPASAPHDALPHDFIPFFDMNISVDTVPMEASHLAAVLHAFMDNAVTHGAARDKPTRVTIAAVDRDVVITVADQGPGVDAKHHETVFEPLSHLASRDVCEGSGMGLATVARIAELYNGTCRAYTNEAGGLSAEFRCPQTPGA